MTKPEGKKIHHLWIDCIHKIVSFKQVDGFRRLDFLTKQEKFEFATEKSSSGYRIQ